MADRKDRVAQLEAEIKVREDELDRLVPYANWSSCINSDLAYFDAVGLLHLVFSEKIVDQEDLSSFSSWLSEYVNYIRETKS
jgi:hypothetical protein